MTPEQQAAYQQAMQGQQMMPQTDEAMGVATVMVLVYFGLVLALMYYAAKWLAAHAK